MTQISKIIEQEKEGLIKLNQLSIEELEEQIRDGHNDLMNIMENMGN